MPKFTLEVIHMIFCKGRNIDWSGAPARATATNGGARRVYGDGIGRAHKSCQRVCRHAQSIGNAMTIAPISSSHTEATNSKSSVADIQPCTSATATADAKRRQGHARA